MLCLVHRRSTRATKGQTPTRFGYDGEDDEVQKKPTVADDACAYSRCCLEVRVGFCVWAVRVRVRVQRSRPEKTSRLGLCLRSTGDGEISSDGAGGKKLHDTTRHDTCVANGMHGLRQDVTWRAWFQLCCVQGRFQYKRHATPMLPFRKSHMKGNIWKFVWRVCNPAAPERPRSTPERCTHAQAYMVFRLRYCCTPS